MNDMTTAPLGAIRSTSKGRVVAAQAAKGFREPKKSTLPARDLVMPSGRVLTYHGVHRISPPGRLHIWQDLSVWFDTHFKVMASIDPDRRFKRLLHLSVSYPDHYPTWEELLEVRYTFYPRTIDVMMIMPADGAYVNIHEYCFQMRETPEAWTEA